MKTILYLLVTLCLMGSLATPKTAAQQLTPQFRLDMSYTEPHFVLGVGRAIGFDPAATDSVDEQFGEDYDYPGSDGGLIPDFYFRYMDTSTLQTRVVIRKMPAANAFTLNYDMHISATDWSKPDQQPTLHWNRSELIPQIKAITVVSVQDTNRVLVDLTKQDSVLIPIAEADNWRHTRVRIYYNLEPSSSSVASSAGATAGQLDRLAVYPNPSVRDAWISFDARQAGEVSVLGYDAAGRVCVELKATCHEGPNTIALPDLSNVHGAIMLQVSTSISGVVEKKFILVARS